MLWTIVVVFLILWLLGFSFSIGGSFIHLLLVVALVVIRHQPGERPPRPSLGPQRRAKSLRGWTILPHT